MKKNLAYLVALLMLHIYFPTSLYSLMLDNNDKQGGNAMDSKPLLLKTVGIWTRPDSPKLIGKSNIFDYMDGAGELYLAYRFDHLESYEYEAEGQKEILVELYFMESSDDAFGLLSLDWAGDAMNLNASSL